MAAAEERVLDAQDMLERFAFDNICKLAFNVDPGCLGGDGTAGGGFMLAFEDAATLSSCRFMYALPILYVIKKFFNLGSESKLRNSIATVYDFADKIISTRMEEKSEKKDEDLLSNLIGNGEISVEYLRYIVISFILASRDTTSSALSWFFWLLSSEPHVEETIIQELDKIRRRSGKEIGDMFTFDELREMHYLQASISEAIRLYPPVPIDTKACNEDDILPDGTLSARIGSFRTTRTQWGGWGAFEAKTAASISRRDGLRMGFASNKVLQVSGFPRRPRMCLGKDMAYIQMKSIAASVLERFAMQVLMEKGKCIEHLLSLTLKVEGWFARESEEEIVLTCRLKLVAAVGY